MPTSRPPTRSTGFSEDSSAERARNELDRELARLVLTVENRVDLDDVERGRETGLGDELESQVSLTVRETTANRRADAGGDVGIECVHVQADVDETRAGDMRERFAHGALHPEPVDIAHREHHRVELAQERAFPLVQRPDADQRGPARIERRQTPAGL